MTPRAVTPRTLIASLLGCLIALGAAASATAQTLDDPVDLGEVTVVDYTRQPLVEAVSETTFGLQLPSGASCPGDSENDQWRVQTFIVPADVDPGTLTYNSIGPEGDGFYALYGLDTNPVTDALTAPNGEPGLPGLITGLRSMSFAIFPPGTLPDGTYRMGVACTFFRDTASYWDALIEVVSDPEDEPGQMRWMLVDAAGAPVRASGGTSDNWLAAALAAVAVGVGAGAIALNRRSRRQPATHQEKA